MSTAHAPVYAQDGKPGIRYQLYHEEKVKGGIALTAFGGSSNVSADSGSIYGQIYVGSDEVIPCFQEFADRVHAHGGALMCQITHMGRRTSWENGHWLPTVGPSVIRDPAHHSVPMQARAQDIKRISTAFGEAARRCRDGNLDGCEILASVHLLGQFLSPLSNCRSDAYGGKLENRARFLLEVLEQVRTQVGDDFIVGVRYTVDESNEYGMSSDEGIAIARLLAQSGLVDFLNINGAYGGTTTGMAETFPGMAYPSAPYIELARRVKEASSLPVFHSSRITDAATADFAISNGYLDMVGMTRPHIADPHIVRKLEQGDEARIRPCVGAGYCLDRVYAGKDMLCIYNTATGREQTIDHQVPLAAQSRKVVIVGGGPAGMEAARVCALRGHKVILFEATNRLGGQVLLAARAGWRKDMIGIADWLASEIDHLGVEVNLSQYAETQDIIDQQPDVVIVASGGIPLQRLPEAGAELAADCWDIFDNQVGAGQQVLLYDETGDHAGLSTADMLSDRAASITVATPNRLLGEAVGGQNYPIYMRNLIRNNARILPDRRLLSLSKKGETIKARFRDVYLRNITEMEFDQVVLVLGTEPVDDVFHQLAEDSINGGEYDLDALLSGDSQLAAASIDGFLLFRIGDAVAARNIHAAVYDAMRLCSKL